MTARLDTLEFVENAMKSGFTEEQAKFQVKEINKLLDYSMISKSDLTNELIKLEQKLTIKLGGIVVACTGILGFILHH